MNRILTRSHTYKIRTLNTLARWIGGCVYCGSHSIACDFSYRLCASCALLITGRHSEQYRCRICANPLMTDDEKCLACIKQPPSFQATHAFSDYSGIMKHLIVRYKFNGSLNFAPLLADIMCHSVKKIENLPSNIISVPQHEQLTQSRGFVPLKNIIQQIDWLKILQNNMQPNILNHAVIRLHQPNLQVKSTKEAREKQIKGAFAATMDLAGLDILLIDDVYTTGSTLKELSKVCHQAGAKSITNLVISRARLVK